jgi:hypothetical protein
MKRIIQNLVVALASTTVLFTFSVAMADNNDDQRFQLRVTKECPGSPPFVSDAPGGFCTITRSSLAILVGSHIFYDQAFYNRMHGSDSTGVLDSNVVLDAGNGNMAVGRCTLDFAIIFPPISGPGLCTFSDGTGNLRGFEARVDVFYRPLTNDWIWRGTNRFRSVGQ